MEAVQSNNITNKTGIKEKKGISGSTLKIIAVVTMLIDHIGAGILARYIIAGREAIMFGNPAEIAVLAEQNDTLYLVYRAMRLIGRIAFPIFCFLLVEGFQKTHNVKKYALRLGLFCLVSEVFFDLAFSSEILEFSYQNVFFTLFLGLLAMIFYNWIENRKWNSSIKADQILKWILQAAVLLLFCGAAEFLRTDYGAIGVACISVIYFFRKQKVTQIVAGCIAFSWEMTAPLAFLPIYFYNGKRGLKLKYLFYVFYPLHLFLIYLVCVYLGIAGYATV